MATVLPIANETPGVENVQENTIQRNAKVQQFNVHTARIHMKHGVTSALLGSLRNIDLKNCGITVLTSSLPNILTLFFSVSNCERFDYRVLYYLLDVFHECSMLIERFIDIQ